LQSFVTFGPEAKPKFFDLGAEGRYISRIFQDIVGAGGFHRVGKLAGQAAAGIGLGGQTRAA